MRLPCKPPQMFIYHFKPNDRDIFWHEFRHKKKFWKYTLAILFNDVVCFIELYIAKTFWFPYSSQKTRIWSTRLILLINLYHKFVFNDQVISVLYYKGNRQGRLSEGEVNSLLLKWSLNPGWQIAGCFIYCFRTHVRPFERGPNPDFV